MSKKITRATFKSFVKRNEGKLFIRNKTTFDAMIDGVSSCGDQSFAPVENEEIISPYTLGIMGVWLVGQSRDYFTSFKQGEFEGIEVSNCCGNFIIAIKTEDKTI